MRNVLFGFLSMFMVASFSGCGDNNGTPTPVKDMTAKPNPDLTQPLNGCNGLLMCYVSCNGQPQSCYDDCDAGANQMGLDLLNALGTCIDTNCFQANNADTGMPYCTNATINDPPCNDCYNKILGNNGACKAAQTACVNNKP
jgi:hypothetical protein